MGNPDLRAHWQRTTMAMDIYSDHVDVSVVIPTWNNSKRLAITLGALRELDIPPGCGYEIVVVENNCSDNTSEVLNSFENMVPLVVVHEPRPGVSSARNAGIRAARGRLIVFADDDVRPDKGWLSAYWDEFVLQPTGTFFCGPLFSEYETTPPVKSLLDIAPWSIKGFDLGAVKQPISYVVEGNWAVPKELLLKAGGFDESKGLDPSSGTVKVGEGRDLVNRLIARGANCLYLPGAAVHHWVPSEKCSVRHIAERLEASGFDETACLVAKGAVDKSHRLAQRAASVVARHMIWLAQRVTGHDASAAYALARNTVGRFRGTLAANSRSAR